MSHFPLLRQRHHSRFSNPLTGTVYDNRKYEQSCFCNVDKLKQIVSEVQPLYGKSKSIPSSLNKVSSQQYQHQKDLDPESLAKSTKIFNLSKRLSSPPKDRCSRSKWSQQTFGSSQLLKSRSLLVPSKPERSVSQSMPREQIRRFKYPQIQVIILDSLSEGKEQLKTVKLQLKRYFDAFFKQSLLGLMFQEFSDIVQRHLNQAIKGEERTAFVQESLEERHTFTNKKSLYQVLVQYQRLDKMQQLHSLIRYYCLPKPEVRSILLQDVQNILGLRLYEEFGFNKENQYVLMTPQGAIIQDFTEIKFSTSKLYLANKDKARELFHRYLDYTKYKRLYSSKYNFRQTLKNNFRSQVVDGHYDDSHSPRHIDEEKRDNRSRAQKILNFKNDKTSYGRVRLIQYLQKQKAAKNKISPSPTKQSQNQGEKMQSSAIIVDQKILLQFKKLKRSCDYSDADFKNEESNKNKILLRILVKQNVYFKTKTPEQITRILQSLGYIKEGQKIGPYSTDVLTLDEYIYMRRIINCNADKGAIIGFVDRYMGYDEYGELQKEQMRQTLAFIIGKEETKTSNIILKTIWGRLQKNGIISNNIVCRNNMQLLFERNKIVYYFIISLIFGTNDTTALDLAQQALQ